MFLFINVPNFTNCEILTATTEQCPSFNKLSASQTEANEDTIQECAIPPPFQTRMLNMY